MARTEVTKALQTADKQTFNMNSPGIGVSPACVCLALMQNEMIVLDPVALLVTGNWELKTSGALQ